MSQELKRDFVIIQGLEFYAFHGASDEEQKIGHRYRVDIRLKTDLSKAGKSDNLEDTIDYGKVATRIVEISTEKQFRLLEALTESIVSKLFAEFPSLEEIELKIQKIAPPVNIIADSVGVEITRIRKM